MSPLPADFYSPPFPTLLCKPLLPRKALRNGTAPSRRQLSSIKEINLKMIQETGWLNLGMTAPYCVRRAMDDAYSCLLCGLKTKSAMDCSEDGAPVAVSPI
jgi:hypothetical protein